MSSPMRADDSCLSCGNPIPEGAKYCPRCGRSVDAPEGLDCPDCKRVNPAGASFCAGCGSPLSPLSRAERRITTVLFADLSGFTQVTERLDAEEVREMIAGLIARLSGCITRWGGFVDKFIGDCVMALFGAPATHENDPERAVRAALDMQAAVREWSKESLGRGGPPIQLRVGINTGPVVSGWFSGGGARDYTAIGDAVNVASRLQGLCEPGGILVGARTFDRTRHLFEYEAEQCLQLRGHGEAVRARYVVGLRAEGPERGFADRAVGLVGRGQELSALRALWSFARSGGARVCLVTGPAGIGKSRLLQELIAVEGLRGEEVAYGHCYPHASSTPWEPVAELLRDLYNLSSALPLLEAAEQIVQATAAIWPPGDASALRVVLGRSVSEEAELVSYRPDDRRDCMIRAVQRAIELAANAPRLLILEDLHWADRASMEYLQYLAETAPPGPILAVLIARPPVSVEETLGRLFAGVRDRIDLGPLSPQESQDLLTRQLGDHELPASLLDRVVERAEGNPLFIEELLKHLLDRGVLQVENDIWRMRGDLTELSVPESIESLLATRMDSLPTPTKHVLQYAAVLGRRFWTGALTDALARRPVERELSELMDGTFVRPSLRSIVSGDREYVFEHLLLQEVAYKGLLRGLRAELHGAVGRWLEGRLADQGAECEEWIAFHYERSREPKRALTYLERGAQAARARGALADAQALLDRARNVASDAPDQERLVSLAEEIAAAAGDVERRRKALDELESLGRRSEDARLVAEAKYRRARYWLDLGELAPAREAGRSALEQFRALGDISRQGDALSLLGRVAHQWGDYPEAMRSYLASLPLQRKAGDRFGEAEVLDRIGRVWIDIGDFTKSLDYFEKARRLCALLGDLPTDARVAAHRATALLWLGRYDEAEAGALEAVELANRCGSRRARTGTELTLGCVFAARGEIEKARRLLVGAAALARAIGRPTLEARARLALAGIESGVEAEQEAQLARELARETGLVHVEILALVREADLALGREDAAADRASAEALEKLRAHRNIQGPEELVYYVRARALLALGQGGAAAEMRERARRIVMSKSRRIRDTSLRERFLSAVALNREILQAEETAI